MSIPPIAVATARMGWKWQWNQLMNGLAPADRFGNYQRPPSQHQNAVIPKHNDLAGRSQDELPHLIIGRSCPWAHRTWLVYELRNLQSNLNILIANPDKKRGRWQIEPSWLGCDSLLSLYQKCGEPPNHRATVPALIDPGATANDSPKLLGNESTQLIEVLNQWPTTTNSLDLSPKELQQDIKNWQNLLQSSVNDGVYRCGFARNQSAYDKACKELFQGLKEVEKSLSNKGPWLCGRKITLADVRLFPTLIRWEMVYQPLFGCSQEPLWSFPNLWRWRQQFLALPSVQKTCDSSAWRNDYFGALFPLRPSNIVPAGPNLIKMVNSKVPDL
ncbi:glutathione S-transferase family protein [Prochlorococcus sp. MIT 1307]|uniref:glutathione S-transferase family protein n=1 Tax=Prochlorococcus sp. MIT 1307 TaxID=3096219 RepID=UPI002A76055C|nr:glutathione S-transferase C-terminal domain-containing protein [Prochlorococcus sp. MIT 1307]